MVDLPEQEECACGDVLDEHIDEAGRIGACQIEGCGCVDFEAAEDH